MAKPNNESCADCRYYEVDERLGDLYGTPQPEQQLAPRPTGWCMRFPPNLTFVDQATSRLLSRYNAVPDTWWCGEYKRENSQPTEGD